jgi:hypothetical protein
MLQIPAFEIVGISSVVAIFLWTVIAYSAGQLKLWTDTRHLPYLGGLRNYNLCTLHALHIHKAR